MKNKKGFLLSILFCLFIFGVTIPLFMSNHKKVSAAGDVGNNTITDLTNTAWRLYDVPGNVSSYPGHYNNITYNINFYSNNNTYYDGIRFVSNEYNDITDIYYISNGVSTKINAKSLASVGAVDGQYLDISIIGGSDVTNIYLISWVQNNATQTTFVSPGTQITHSYWSPDGIITLTDNQQVLDENIQYTILYNEFNDSYEGTTQTGLNFYNGYNNSLNLPWSYINTSNNNSLYNGASNNINNAMWLEFTIGDTMNTELYNFMELWGTWFDDQSAYLVGINQGYAEGLQNGRALGQADGTQYTGLVTGIFNGLGGLLSIQVFPNITIGLLIGLPLLLGAFVIIIKILRG